MPEQEKTNTEGQSQVENTNDFSKVAEAITAQHNPFEQVVHDTFESGPYILEEKKGEDAEVKAEDKPDTIINKEQKEEVKTEAKPEVTETKTETKKEITAEEILSSLNSTLDSSFSSVEEIKSILEENQKYKQAENELRGLAQEDRARIQVGQEYGDYGLYDKVLGIDTSKLSPKEALKQVYLLENPGKSTQYLEKAFEKNYTKTYEEETDEEFSKLKLEEDGQDAIQKLIATQEQFKEFGKIDGGVDPEQQKKAKQAEDEKWFTAVDSVLNKTDRITYNLEDGLDINIVMDAKDKQVIQNAMDRPVEFLKSMITDEKGNYDHEALFEFIMRNVYFQQAFEEARKSGAAHREEKILKEKKNSVIETGKAGDPAAKTNVSEELAANIRSFMNY